MRFMEDKIQIIMKQSAEVTKNVASIKTDITNAISENNKSLQNCINAGETLLSLADDMNDELDARIASFIIKAKATQKAMKERRSAVTQVFDLVKKGFTTMETLIDPKSEESIVYKLQKRRDEYAAYKLEQQRKAEEERIRIARIEAAKNQLHDEVISICNQIVTEKINGAVSELNRTFSLLTLDNVQKVKTAISEYPDKIKLSDYLADRKPSFSHEIEESEARKIMNDAYKEVSAELLESYSNCVSNVKRDIMDLFDSKISELEEQKKLEEERKRKEEEAKRAEEERKRKEEELRKAKDEEERLLRESELKAAEEERKRKEIEMKKAEEERLLREAELKAAEEEAQRERERKALDEQQRRADEERIRKAQREARTLFDVTPANSTPNKVKVTQHIEIDSPNGYLAIIQMWWTHEGATMTLESLEKKLGFMVKTCEKLKNKEDISIIDENIRYVEDVVAK